MGVEQSCNCTEDLPAELELGGVSDVLLTSVDVDFPLRPGRAMVFFVNGKFVWVYGFWDPSRATVVGQWSANADYADTEAVKAIIRASNTEAEIRDHFLESNLNLNTAF